MKEFIKELQLFERGSCGWILSGPIYCSTTLIRFLFVDSNPFSLRDKQEEKNLIKLYSAG
jgi:hypothetical protein